MHLAVCQTVQLTNGRWVFQISMIKHAYICLGKQLAESFAIFWARMLFSNAPICESRVWKGLISPGIQEKLLMMGLFTVQFCVSRHVP